MNESSSSSDSATAMVALIAAMRAQTESNHQLTEAIHRLVDAMFEDDQVEGGSAGAPGGTFLDGTPLEG